jgi:hypothetical protein
VFSTPGSVADAMLPSHLRPEDGCSFQTGVFNTGLAGEFEPKMTSPAN